MKKPEGHPDFPVWKLERYLLGELPAPEMERISGLKETDPVLAEWIQALQAEHRDLAEMHPTGRVAGRIWNRLREGGPADRPAWAPPRLWIPAFALLLLGVLLPLNFSSWVKPASPPAEGSEETRLKGLQPALFLYRKAGESALSLKTGDRVHPGDLIQIYYAAAGRDYGAIFSLDREGKVTWHLPDRGNQSASLAKDGKVSLGFAFELDSLSGFERFYFVASDRPFALDSALAGIPKGTADGPAASPDRLLLPKSFFQNSIVLLKESRI
jgi:hypothetical protein